MGLDLARPDAAALRRCGAGIRAALERAGTMEAAARALCRFLYDELAGPAGERARVVVRCYKTHPYGALPPDVQRFAKRAFGAVAITPSDPSMRCLTLLASAGDEAAWNDRRASRGTRRCPCPARTSWSAHR